MNSALDKIHRGQPLHLVGTPTFGESFLRYVGLTLAALGGVAVLVLIGAIIAREGRGVLAFPLTFLLPMGLIISRLGVKRRRWARNPVVLDFQGLTVRGIGPVPWAHLGSAYEDTWYEHGANSGWVREWVVDLTPEGVAHARRLPRDVRQALVGASSRYGGSPRIVIPGVKGLSNKQMAELINTARDLYYTMRP